MGKKKKKNIWWLPDYYFTPPARQPGEGNNYSFGVFPVMVCPKCEIAWEYGLVGKKRIPIYYDDFPTFKLKDIICPRCEEKDETD